VRESLHALKDLGLSAAARAALNEQCRAYGTVTDLTVDTRSKTLRVALLLLGEAEAVELTLERYEVLRVEHGALLRLGPVRCPRPWVERLANDLADKLLDDRCWPLDHPALARLAHALL
jgi:hypothetical protein